MRIKLEDVSIKTFLVFVFILCFCSQVSAQGKYSFSGGWGYYERLNIGVNRNLSGISSLAVYGGSNLGLNNNKAWTAGLSFIQVFKKPSDWIIKPGYSVGILYWSSDDDLYYFKNMSFPVMALLSFPVTKSISIRAEGGMIFTAVMQSERKQNVEAGYPDRFNGNMKLSIIYNPGAK